MKVAVYNSRDDEKEYFEKYSKEFQVDLKHISKTPDIGSVKDADGCTCLNITTDSMITKEMLDAYYDMGVRFISTRTIGYEHIDVKYANKIGIQVGNVAYSASSVADYAIMLMLMVLRKAKHIMYRSLGQDYAITAIRGRELPNMTVGIVGTGKIGATVAKHLRGFGCKLLAFDPYQNKELADIVTYVDLETLYANCDIISLHVPATPQNTHMINKDTLQRMKDGVVIINTARGALINSLDLIEALENGKVSAAGLDVIEGDREIYYRDYKYKTIPHREMAILNSMPNVLMMPHMAFYTDQAVDDMVRNSLESCVLFAEGKQNPWLIKV